jgi:hypothetical protein
MPAAQDLIQDSLEMLGVYAPGETISSADAARGLSALNIIIDEFASQLLFIYQFVPYTFATVAGTAIYSIGQSAGVTIVATRPSQIVTGEAEAKITISAAETPINVVSAIEFRSLAGYSPPGSTPDTLWYNPTYPNGTITLLPTPNAVGTVSFNAWEILQSFANLNSSAQLAVGVQEVLTDMLSVKLKSYFSEGVLNQVVAARAMGARDILRYQSMRSRATFNRYALSTNPQKPNI